MNFSRPEQTGEASITVVSGRGEIRAFANGHDEVILAWEGSYMPEDRIEFAFPETKAFYIVRVDDSMDEALVYMTEQKLVYEVPFEERKASYNPKAFTGERHYLTLRRARAFEVGQYRNLAKNVLDQHGDRGCYPHAWANVETRGESVFAARNAIDGVLANTCHGEWPYESWGINRREDAQITLEFGREVDLDTVVLYTRADFPHDSWWTKVSMVFSDGSVEEWGLEKQTEPHVWRGEKHAIRWIRLEKLVKAEDPSPFPALTQIEVYGKESK